MSQVVELRAAMVRRNVDAADVDSPDYRLYRLLLLSNNGGCTANSVISPGGGTNLVHNGSATNSARSSLSPSVSVSSATAPSSVVSPRGGAHTAAAASTPAAATAATT